MAQRTAAAYKTVANSRFADNTTGLIEEIDHRDQHTDAADSFLNKTDGGTITGNVGIGVASSSSAKLSLLAGASQLYGTLDAPTSGSAYMSLKFNGTIFGFIGQASGLVTGGTDTDYALRAVNNFVFAIGSSEKMRLNSSGNVGIGITPTAVLHLKSGTAAANTAPLKLTTGTALTTPEDGALEYHSSHLYFTIGSTRYQLDQQATNLTSDTFSPTFTSETNLDSTPTATALTAKYTRVGDMVTVTMFANVDPTASGQYSFFATIPVASNFTAATDLLGLGSSGSADGHRCEVSADVANDRAKITGTSSGTTTASIYIMYTYKVM
jgi:hypothetical protein